MMLSPDIFYENELKGKTETQIRITIRSLKQGIGRLKKIMEQPEYECTKRPSERTMISFLRKYLELAKQALEEAGGTYTPSVAERLAKEFDDNVPYINKVVFCIGGYWDGYETKTFTIEGDKVHTHIEHSLNLTPSNIGDGEIEEMDKEYFLDSLKDLHIGEWRKRYDAEILDGTEWDLEICFSNGRKPVKFYGNNAYPYNFDRALELFKVEE